MEDGLSKNHNRREGGYGQGACGCVGLYMGLVCDVIYIAPTYSHREACVGLKRYSGYYRRL